MSDKGTGSGEQVRRDLSGGSQGGAVTLPAGYATVRKVRGPAEGINELTGLRVVLGGCYSVPLSLALVLTAEGGEFEPAASEDRSRIDAARKEAEAAAKKA